MKENIVMTKSYAFALKCIELYKILCAEQKEFVMSKQLLRSGTSVGALIKEAEHAESKADFIHKMSISLKEANETEYWLMLLKDSRYITQNQFESLIDPCQELIRLLISIIKSSKHNKNSNGNK